METKHLTVIIGAAVLAVLGIYVIAHVAKGITPAVDIDDQMNRLR